MLIATTTISFAFAGNPLPKTEATDRAQKTFVRDFPNADHVNWVESNNGDLYTAYFKMYDVKTVANFGRDGQLISVLRYYKEDRLPLSVLALVKSEYENMTIFGVTEYSRNRNEDVAYYLRLEDNAHWYTVKVVGNDMDLVEEFDKQ